MIQLNTNNKLIFDPLSSKPFREQLINSFINELREVFVRLEHVQTWLWLDQDLLYLSLTFQLKEPLKRDIWPQSGFLI